MNTMNARDFLEGAVGDRAMFDRWADLRMGHEEVFLGRECTAFVPYRTAEITALKHIHSFALVETSHLSLQRELLQQNVGFELVPEVLAARK
jgi:hypothetical protein